jgi:hypothetical protein
MKFTPIDRGYQKGRLEASLIIGPVGFHSIVDFIIIILSDFWLSEIYSFQKTDIVSHMAIPVKFSLGKFCAL